MIRDNKPISRVSVLILAFAIGTDSHASTADDVKVFFEEFVERMNDFDVGLSELYDPDAKIKTLRDGTTYQEMSGSQWKELLVKAMPIAERVGDVSKFTNVHVISRGDGFRVTAHRYSALKCFEDRNYHFDVKKAQNSWRIVEESSTTTSLSRCKPSEKLAESLSRLENGILPYLPLDLDSETRLETVNVVGSALIYNQRLHTISAHEFDLTKLVPILQQLGVQEACGKPEMKALVDDGATISYSYVDRNDQAIAQVNISPGLCP